MLVLEAIFHSSDKLHGRDTTTRAIKQNEGKDPVVYKDCDDCSTRKNYLFCLEK